ncbi:MAG: capsular polysaccharide biosynthesis protein, partial [Pseudomonadota bacterium]
MSGEGLRDLAVFSGGFLRQTWLRDALACAGWRVKVGVEPGKTAAIGVWGRRPVSARGLRSAERYGLPVLTIEDGFLRSVEPGRKEPAVSLLLDDLGVHFACGAPSRLERLLAEEPLSDPQLLSRASAGRALLREHRLSKYNAFEEDAADLPQDYVLVVDQTRADASITHGGAGRRDFARMLEAARRDHPDAAIVVRAHPAAKQGHFTQDDLDNRTRFAPPSLNPVPLLEGARAVYTVTSQLGFEAICLGHRPKVFGQPFYMGWGLSDDLQSNPRRGRALSADQLFAGAMLQYPFWYDPGRKREVSFEEAVDGLLARRKLWAVTKPGLVMAEASAWKRPHLAKILAKPAFVANADQGLDLAARSKASLAVWASRMAPDVPDKAKARAVPLLRVEDGFLRSLGLGAELRPLTSLVIDDQGIYFDPTTPSRLDALIAQSDTLPDAALARARALRHHLCASGLSKYNLTNATSSVPSVDGQRRVLVVGQVSDDASLRLGGAPGVDTASLLRQARAAHPDAFLIYKPHPDVEAGLRPGLLEAPEADWVARNSAIVPLIESAEHLWTISSLAGFEALLRKVPVTCLGRPFYAGWGLTDDLGPEIAHRTARP